MNPQLSRILVVDDEPDMCWALENTLAADGYQVTVSSTGAEALQRMAEGTYAVAFIDAKLPDVDGLKLAEMIHQQDARTAIVLVSGYYYQEDQAITEGLRRDRFMGFIAKPFDLNTVRQMARKAVQRAVLGS
jgi:DNA-binding NtrC family response regulator